MLGKPKLVQNSRKFLKSKIVISCIFAYGHKRRNSRAYYKLLYVCNEDIICNRWRRWWTSPRADLRNLKFRIIWEWKPYMCYMWYICVYDWFLNCHNSLSMNCGYLKNKYMIDLNCHDSLSMNCGYLKRIWFMKVPHMSILALYELLILKCT